MKTPHVKIDSVERVLMDNANKLEALKSRYAARKERLKQDRTLNDEGEQATGFTRRARAVFSRGGSSI